MADLESASPSPRLVQSVGETVSGHRSPSRRWNGLERVRSISARGSPSPELGVHGGSGRESRGALGSG